MSKNYYKSGDWNLICDVCSSKIKASKSKHRWDGFIVCPSCYETRHPQDFLRSKADKQSVPYSRPRPADVYVHSCTIASSSSYAGLGTADCSKADTTYNSTYNDLLIEYVCTIQSRSAIAGVAVAGCVKAGFNLAGYF